MNVPRYTFSSAETSGVADATIFEEDVPSRLYEVAQWVPTFDERGLSQIRDELLGRIERLHPLVARIEAIAVVQIDADDARQLTFVGKLPRSSA